MTSRADRNNCPLCNNLAKIEVTTEFGLFYVVCDTCGRYGADRTLWETYGHDTFRPEAYRLSALTRRHTDARSRPLLKIHPENIRQLLEREPPKSVIEKLDDTLLWLSSKQSRPDIWLTIGGTDYPLIQARDLNELRYLAAKLVESGFLERPSTGNALQDVWNWRVTLAGWIRVGDLSRQKSDSNQAFVAMWFDASMDAIWSESFVPALEATGFSAVRSGNPSHNDNIINKIIADIRRSGLLVADFTGHRGGVYFEAGFAFGLGIPVIRTCRKDEFGKLHFDVSQWATIEWETAADLKDKLIAQIEATIPGHTREAVSRTRPTAST